MENKLFQEKWTALQSKIKQKWPKFTDQELKAINGEKNKFLNELQKKYGIDRNAGERELQTIGQTLVAAGAGAKPQQQQSSRPQQGQPQQQQSPKNPQQKNPNQPNKKH